MLVRVEPFTTAHVKFQASYGKPLFDTRLLWSIPLQMEGLHNSSGYLREHPGDFFTMPLLLVNENHFNLGSPNASNARQFTETQRIALDSGPVSASIDLFFGVHWNSAEKGNAWPPWAMPGGVDPKGRGTLFGMIPVQVFQQENPPRGEPPAFKVEPQKGRFQGKVIAIKKGVVICDDGMAYEFVIGSATSVGRRLGYRGIWESSSSSPAARIVSQLRI
jgi:hypothetical protein